MRSQSSSAVLGAGGGVGAVRAGLGSAEPYDILPAVWLSSVVSVTVAVLAVRLFRGGKL